MEKAKGGSEVDDFPPTQTNIEYVATSNDELSSCMLLLLGDSACQSSGLPQWELLEALANRNVTNLDPNMEAINGIDDDLYQMWLFNGGSSSSDIIDFLTQYVEKREYIKNKIDMVGSILFGPEKGRSILHSATSLSLDDMLMQCSLSSLHLFSQHCGFQSQPYIKYRRLFVNMCNHMGEDKASIKEAIIAACGNNKSFGAVVDVRNPTITVVPAPTRGSSDYCERVFVNGVSRNILGSFAKIYLRFIPTLISRDWHDKSQICIHRDASLGLRQCDKDDWRPPSNIVMSPHENKIVDVKFTSGIQGSVDISLDEGSQGWRYFFLAMGTALLFLAPSVCKYILFRDADDMAGLFIKWVMRVTVVACIFQEIKEVSQWNWAKNGLQGVSKANGSC